jgi:uncharacterized protein (DUF302 family)
VRDKEKGGIVMKDVSYGISKNLGKTDFDETLRRVTEALKAEGFGVLTDIDVQATLKKRIDADIRKYRILGACNPPAAFKTVQAEPFAGLFLPCNVIVMEDENREVIVSAINPREMFKIIDNPSVKETASQIGEKLTRVISAL